jgi:hypothetical protein
MVVNSMMFLYQNICKYSWTSPDGKTHDQIDHILLWHLRILNLLGVVAAILVTIWWLQKLGEDWQ